MSSERKTATEQSLPMSSLPDESANPHVEGDDWKKSDEVCPVCKDRLVWISGWWDDPPDHGGACIGEKYECGDCGWTD